MFPSYRNQSVDLLFKLTDWFLYDGNIGRQKVKCQRVSVKELSVKELANGLRWVKQIKTTIGLIAKRREIYTRPRTQTKNELEGKKKKLLDSEKYKEFKKKETARIKEYRLKEKLTAQLQYNISTTATE